MGAMERITIAMPAEMADRLRAAVEGGEYASTGEIVREALADWSRQREADQQALEELREAVRIGDESGPSIPADQVYAELRAIIEEQRGRA
jgi:antitoxin ParD1/3/4